MILSIQNIVNDYGCKGDILLYRDEYEHKKRGLCEYLVKDIRPGQEVVTYSDGAFGLYLARALPKNIVHTCYNNISPDYGELMEAQKNLMRHPNMIRSIHYNDFVDQHPEYVEINQYTDHKCVDYYREHFKWMYEQELQFYHIDAFCDYGHSGATLAGAIEAGFDWDFIMATLNIDVEIGAKPIYRNHMYAVKDKIKYTEFCTKIDTFELGKKIEEQRPDYGNMYEATRSITGALSYLKKNPGKTVLVYVGDSFEKEGTKFRGNSLSHVGTTDLLMKWQTLEAIRKGEVPDKQIFEEYYKLVDDLYDRDHKKYIFTDLLVKLITWLKEYPLSSAKYIKLCKMLQKVNPYIHNTTLNMISAYLSYNEVRINDARTTDMKYGDNILIQSEGNITSVECRDVLSYMQQRGVL